MNIFLYIFYKQKVIEFEAVKKIKIVYLREKMINFCLYFKLLPFHFVVCVLQLQVNDQRNFFLLIYILTLLIINFNKLLNHCH